MQKKNTSRSTQGLPYNSKNTNSKEISYIGPYMVSNNFPKAIRCISCGYAISQRSTKISAQHPGRVRRVARRRLGSCLNIIHPALVTVNTESVNGKVLPRSSTPHPGQLSRTMAVAVLPFSKLVMCTGYKDVLDKGSCTGAERRVITLSQ